MAVPSFPSFPYVLAGYALFCVSPNGDIPPLVAYRFLCAFVSDTLLNNAKRITPIPTITPSTNFLPFAYQSNQLNSVTIIPLKRPRALPNLLTIGRLIFHILFEPPIYSATNYKLPVYKFRLYTSVLAPLQTHLKSNRVTFSYHYRSDNLSSNEGSHCANSRNMPVRGVLG